MAKIFRDHFGVPHISASSYQDAARAIAYSHSEDDFFTLQSWFLAIKQKAGHHDDWDGPYLDFLSIFFDIEEKTRMLSSHISDEYRQLSECYCDGINMYAKQHEDEILDNSIFPVSCEDLFQVQHLMEVIGIQIDKPYSYLSKGGNNEFPHKEGSNIIAISAEKSCNSNSMIAISPHQMLEGIFSYYEIHVSVQDNEFHGFILPCSFAIFMGTNFNIAWGATASYPEMYNIYKIDVQKKFGQVKYFSFDGRNVALKKHTYKNYTKLYGKIPTPIVKSYYESEYGNIVEINKSYYLIRIDMLGKQYGSEMMYELSLCKSNREVLDLSKRSSYTYLDYVCIDKGDNILFIHNTHEKKREDSALHYKDVLHISHLKEELMATYYDDNLITEENPKCCYIVSANQSPLKVTDKERLGEEFRGLIYHNENSRSLRIKEILNSKERISIDDLKKLLFDYKINLPLIRNVDLSVINSTEIDCCKSVLPLIKLLREWDGYANPESEAAAVFALFFYKYKEKYYVYSKDPDVVKIATKQEVVDCLKWVKKYYTEGQTLSDVQYLKRENISEGIGGVPDSINTVRPYFEKGKLFAEEASAFRMIVDLKSRISLTCHPYGASSNEDDSNFTSQMKMFIDGEYKELKPFNHYQKQYKYYEV